MNSYSFDGIINFFLIAFLAILPFALNHLDRLSISALSIPVFGLSFTLLIRLIFVIMERRTNNKAFL